MEIQSGPCSSGGKRRLVISYHEREPQECKVAAGRVLTVAVTIAIADTCKCMNQTGRYGMLWTVTLTSGERCIEGLYLNPWRCERNVKECERNSSNFSVFKEAFLL